MGKNRGINKQQTKEKISITDEFELTEKEIRDVLQMYYEKRALGWEVRRTMSYMKNTDTLSEEAFDFFCVLGLLEFSTKIIAKE